MDVLRMMLLGLSLALSASCAPSSPNLSPPPSAAVVLPHEATEKPPIAETATKYADDRKGAFAFANKLGDSRFLHEDEVGAVWVSSEEIRTLSKGEVWRWNRDGVLKKRVSLRGCSDTHGGATRDGIFSADGSQLLAFCIGDSEYRLFNMLDGRQVAQVGKLDAPLYCGDRFFAIDESNSDSSLVALSENGQKSVHPSSPLRDLACTSGMLVALTKEQSIVSFDANGTPTHLAAGPFSRIVHDASSLAAVKHQETEFLRLSKSRFTNVGAIAKSYLNLESLVSELAPNRVLLRSRYSARGDATLREPGGKVLWSGLPGVAAHAVDSGQKIVWVARGFRLESYSLQSGEALRPLPDPYSYRHGQLEMVSPNEVWTRFQSRWSRLDAESGWAHSRLRITDTDIDRRDSYTADHGKILTAVSGDVLEGDWKSGKLSSFAELGTSGTEDTLWRLPDGSTLLARESEDSDADYEVYRWTKGATAPTTYKLAFRKEQGDRAPTQHGLWFLPALGRDIATRLDLNSGKKKRFNMAKYWLWPRQVGMQHGREVLLGFDMPFKFKGDKVRHLKGPAKLRIWSPTDGDLAATVPPDGVELVEADQVGFVPMSGEPWLYDATNGRLFIYSPDLKELRQTIEFSSGKGADVRISFAPEGMDFAIQFGNGVIEVWRRT